MVYEAIRKRMPRREAPDLARGTGRFSDDLGPGDALVLRVVRSDRAHARILGLDVGEALRSPGCVGVLTAGDIPGRKTYGLIDKDQPLLAEEKVRYQGEALALVVAVDRSSAEAAASLVGVAYQDLPVVSDPREALAPWAPRIHEKGNLLVRKSVRRGDAAGALKGCPVVIQRTYETPFLEHAYMEPDAGVGYWDAEGILTLHASTQNPHYDRKEVADILGLPEDRVRVLQAATGGGFGSKLDLVTQGYLGLALFHFRRPVRLVYEREEVFRATPKRHALRIAMETGADSLGRLVALRARILCDTGAYASYGLAVATRAAIHATGPYRIPHVDVESLCVHTNNPVAGAMRGFGVPQTAVAHESQMDLLAEALGMDPLEIRRINGLRPGDTTPTGQVLGEGVGFLETLEAIAPRYREMRDQAEAERREGGETGGARGEGGPWRRGAGLGAMWYGIGNTGMPNPSSVHLRLETSGQVCLHIGAADIGQGSTTVLCQIAAEVLGLSPGEIAVAVADTGQTHNAGATSASRQTYISGNAVREAAERVRGALLAEAAETSGLDVKDLVLEGGGVRGSGPGAWSRPLGELAGRLAAKGSSLVWEGSFDPATTPLDPETGQGIPYGTYAFGCQAAGVAVDPRTGRVRVERLWAAHDVGMAINPMAVEGQIEGGVAMGLGLAVSEAFVPGHTMTLGEYHIPTSMDMPEIHTILVEKEEPSGPFGAKGVGEPALIPTAPAILNGIADAMGGRIYRLPASPERVWACGNGACLGHGDQG